MSNDLINACDSGNINKVKAIINKYETNIFEIKNLYLQFDRALYQACQQHHINIIEYLLEYSEIHEFRINFYSHNYTNIIGQFCSLGNLNIIKRLIKYGEKDNIKIDLHQYNEHIFRCACLKGIYKCAKYILDYYDKNNEYIQICVWKAIIPSIFGDSCLFNLIEIVQLLIQYSKHKSNDYRIGKDICFCKEYANLKILKYICHTKYVLETINNFILNNNLIDMNDNNYCMYINKYDMDYILVV